MKAIRFVLLFAILVILTGCSTRVMHQGVEITGHKVHTTTIHNDAPRPILVEAQAADVRLRATFQMIKPGEHYRFQDTSDWSVTYLIRYWDEASQSPVGEVMRELRFQHNSMWDREVHITELTLYNKSEQLGVVANRSGRTLQYANNQGHSFILRNGEEKMLSLLSGRVTYTVTPLDGYNRWQKSETFTIDHRADRFWTDKDGVRHRIGWYSIINDVWSNR